MENKIFSMRKFISFVFHLEIIEMELHHFVNFSQDCSYVRNALSTVLLECVFA